MLIGVALAACSPPSAAEVGAESAPTLIAATNPRAWDYVSIGGDFAYPDHGPVIDVRTRLPVADIPLTEKLLEIRFDGEHRPLAAGQR